MSEATQLAERLDRDDDFAAALEHDPFTTLRGAGLEELAVAAERERDRIAQVVERIYEDDEFRQAVEQDPSGALGEWVPEIALEAVLVLAGAPDDVLERASADVEAHLSLRKPLTVAAAAAVLGSLAFAQEAAAASSPATTAQVTPAAAAQVSRAVVPGQASSAVASSQVRQAISTAQLRGAVRGSWYGIDAHRLQLRVPIASILRG
jgi:hypothetical protein